MIWLGACIPKDFNGGESVERSKNRKTEQKAFAIKTIGIRFIFGCVTCDYSTNLCNKNVLANYFRYIFYNFFSL